MKEKTYFDKPSRKARVSNQPTTSGKLSKDGQIYKNNLLDTDYTSQQGFVKKRKGV